MKKFTFVTDTATLCVFDLAALKHRLDDGADWWSIQDEELLEINKGNVAFVGIGEDGLYSIKSTNIAEESAEIKCNLNILSGKVFVGAGEEVTSDGLEPEGIRGGAILDLYPGKYKLFITRTGPREFGIHFTQTDTEFNCFEKPLSI